MWFHSHSVLFNQPLSTWHFGSMLGLFCHFCLYIFSSPGRAAPEPWTPWRSKATSLLDRPQWSPFLQQPIFTAAWVKDVCAKTLKCPHFYTELIHRLLLIQSKAKVQVLHSSFFWRSGTTLQLLHPNDAMKFSPALTSLTPAGFIVVCVSQTPAYEPANSHKTLSGAYFCCLWINPRSHAHPHKGINAF